MHELNRRISQWMSLDMQYDYLSANEFAALQTLERRIMQLQQAMLNKH